MTGVSDGRSGAVGRAPDGDLIAPHGGTVVLRWAGAEEAEREAGALPILRISRRQRADLDLLAGGALSPLRGFMGHEDLDSVLHRSRLKTGEIWTIPIVLAASRDQARRLTPGDRVLLQDEHGAALGTLDLSDRRAFDREEYARRVFLTTERAHPGVRRLFEEGDWLLGGPVTVLRRARRVPAPG